MATSTTSKGDRTYKRKRGGINTDDINRDTNSSNVASGLSNASQNASKNLICNNDNSPVANTTKRRRGPRTRNYNNSITSNTSLDTNSNTASNSSSNAQEQVLNDEEYAKNLQRQFDESFLNMQEIERKDRELAARLEREEIQTIQNNVQQNFQPILPNMPNIQGLPIYQNNLQQNLIPTQIPIQLTTQMQPTFQPTSLQQNGVMNLNQVPYVSSQQISSNAIASNNTRNYTNPHQHPIKHNRGRSRVANTNTNTTASTSASPPLLQPPQPPTIVSVRTTTATTSTTSNGLNTNQQLRQPTNVSNQLNQPSTATTTTIITTNNNSYSNNSYQPDRLLINDGINDVNSVLFVQDKYSILPTYECTKRINDNENECTICFEEYSIGCKITHLACVHKFHESCIKKWLKTTNADKCPICNKYAFAFST